MNIKLSIIISLKNNKVGLYQTLQSIRDQLIDPNMLEVVIVDSNSIDKPFKIIEGFKNHLKIKWVSRYDTNIYNAWNFGLNMTKGTHICFIGSSDTFLPNSLNVLMKNIDTNSDYQIITSKSLIKLKNGKKFVSGKKFIYDEFCKKFTTNHSGLIYNKKIFEHYGNFNENYGPAGDYQFLLRNAHIFEPTFVDIISCEYLVGGISSNSVDVLFSVYKLKSDLKILSKINNIASLIHGISVFYFRLFFGYRLGKKID